MRLSKADFHAIRAKTAQKRAKRDVRVAENASLASVLAQTDAGRALAEAVGVPTPPKTTGNAPSCPENAPKARKPRKGPSARRRAFLRLAEICRTFVLLRCKWTNNGKCEIAMCCGGEGEGTVWYHGWPQAGGNGLKYDARSHFASCGPCNMGEYGARMNGSPLYINRHKELLGAEWNTLNALHGRRPISTKEAMEMAQDYERRISMREW